MLIFVGGPSRSGTRLVFDLVGELGLDAYHAALPGFKDNPSPPPNLDLKHLMDPGNPYSAWQRLKTWF